MATAFHWDGRQDGPGEEFQRYHHLFSNTAASSTASASHALIGFAVDEGVQRNQGSPGAASGPDAIRSVLSNMVPHHSNVVIDHGNITCADRNLEGAQDELARKVADTLSAGSLPVVLGGGHEVSYGSFKGLMDFAQSLPTPPRLGIINFDAHFDMRADALPSSGTPFLQAARLCEEHGQDFAYLVAGIAEHSNTPALFDTAGSHNARWILDVDLQSVGDQNESALEHVEAFVEDLDLLYVTVDMDVFPASVSPGVSAPASRGVPVPVVENLLNAVLATGKVAVFDVAETNPNADHHQLTPRLAALLIHTVLSSARPPELLSE